MWTNRCVGFEYGKIEMDDLKLYMYDCKGVQSFN